MFSETYHDLRVIDLSTNIAGPLAAMIFGDMGADVIKVERQPVGDDTRRLSPSWKGTSTVFLSMNRNKRSILLDFKSAADLDVLKKLIETADVVVESFPPGLAEKLNLTFSDLKKINSKIIVCSVTAFGDGEIGSKMPGYDALVQSVSGLMSFTGSAETEPVRIAPSILDSSTGMWGAMSIMAALHNRKSDSQAQHVRPALIDSAFMMMSHQVTAFKATGDNPEKLGSGAPSAVPYRVFAGCDGDFMLATASQPQFVRLCEALDKNELVSDPLYLDMECRIKNRQSLDGILLDIFKEKPIEHWLKFLASKGLSVGAVNSVEEAMSLDVVKERNLFFRDESLDSKDEMPLMRLPFDLKNSSLRMPPPKLGEHTDEILNELDIKR